MRVGLLGFGAIGQQVVDGLVGPDVEIVAILTRRPRGHPLVVTDIDAFLGAGPEVVVEAASAAAVAEHALAIVALGADLIVASSAALVDARLRARLAEACRASGARVYVPAGALCGLDALAAAADGGLETVSLRVVEPGFGRVVYEGSALEGGQRFPSRLNVAATTALAISADLPVVLTGGDRREITLSARGAFGEFTASMWPQPRKDRLTHIVALSLLATLRRRYQPVQIG
jgi:aspartate dehydrogenase